MRSVLPRTKEPPLRDRLAALRELVEVAEGRLEGAEVAAARALLERAEERLGLGSDRTVVALAGATGSGKSSLFNALAGEELSRVGVTRPTTDSPLACVWGSGSEELLDWLRVPKRHHKEDPALEGLVLLDLPDHDSTEVHHRLEVDRLVRLVDVFVWVVDPQKYADAALHEGYLRPLAAHAAVTLVVLNHIDHLSDVERRQCQKDLERLLEADGLRRVRVLATSARTGEGMDALKAAIKRRVEEERAVTERLTADLHQLARDLSYLCRGKDVKRTVIPEAERERLVDALSGAAGVPVVTRAVARTHRRDAGLAMGWPFTRWLRRFRPDPLRRLHLRQEAGGRTSLPPASPAQRAEVENAVRRVATGAATGLPDPWPVLVRSRAGGSVDQLLDAMDEVVGGAGVGNLDRPRWWSAAGVLQVILTTMAFLGFAWLALLFGLEWLQIPRPPTPEVRELPWPTLLLIGGLLGGFLLSLLCAQLARFGAARRRRRVEQRLRGAVGDLAESSILAPVEEEVASHHSFCRALELMGGGR